MRITYIHQHFKTPSEAGGTRSYEFAKRLARDGHQVTIICGGPSGRRYEIDDFRVVQLRIPYENKMSIHRRMSAMASFMARSVVTAVRQPADVVLATSTPLLVAVPGILAAKFHRARFVFEVRDLWPEVPHRLGIIKSGLLYRSACILEKLAYARADHVVALSPGMAEGVRAIDPTVPITVVPNAADHDFFAEALSRAKEIRKDIGWHDQERVAVYAGSFGWIYDIPHLVRIAAASKRWRFVLIGTGALEHESRSLATELGLSVDDVFLGSLPKTDVARYIAAADICLSSVERHPSLEPASINKIFDALAAGKPVGVTHDGWLSELLESQGAGWRLSESAVEAANELDTLRREEVDAASEAAWALGWEQFDRESLYAVFASTLVAEQVANG